MDFIDKQRQEEHARQLFQERGTCLQQSINELMKSKDFRRFVKELITVQSIEDARCFDNALAMAYNNGRRSVMVELKGFFTEQQWQKLMEFNLHERD